jgi:hypothetical protein
MLVFVIPLRNPETAQNWERCNDLCQQTVRSALAQTDDDVRVIVVCKDFTPNTNDPRLTIVRRDYAAPPNTWEDRARDKYLKIGHGLAEARQYSPCYIMKLDADDLVDRNLAAAVHAANHRPGYYIERGYRWREGSAFIRPVNDFHKHCGSSNIIWAEADELPASPDADMSALPLMRFGHNIAVEEYAKLGTPLTQIKSRAGIYRVGHGENFTAHLRQNGVTQNRPNWKFYVGQALRLAELRPLTPSLKREFFGQNS